MQGNCAESTGLVDPTLLHTLAEDGGEMVLLLPRGVGVGHMGVSGFGPCWGTGSSRVKPARLPDMG